MSLTIDYVTMPPKSQEVSQLHVNEINRLAQENQQMETQFQNMVRENSEKTIRREKAKNEELKNEEERKNKKRKKKKNSQGENNDDSSEEEKEVHFDIMI